MILTILLSVCMLFVFLAIENLEPNNSFKKVKIIHCPASIASWLGGIISIFFLVGTMYDMISGDLKPYGSMGFNVFRVVPRLNGNETRQYKFHAMFEEYTWWGRRKKGEWPARWISEEMKWEIYQDKEWRLIEVAEGSEDNISWDNRGPHDE